MCTQHPTCKHIICTSCRFRSAPKSMKICKASKIMLTSFNITKTHFNEFYLFLGADRDPPEPLLHPLSVVSFLPHTDPPLKKRILSPIGAIGYDQLQKNFPHHIESYTCPDFMIRSISEVLLMFSSGLLFKITKSAF